MKSEHIVALAIGFGLIPVGLTYHIYEALKTKKEYGTFWSKKKS